MIALVTWVLLAAMLAGTIVFVGLYSWRTQWWLGEVGWHLVVFPVALGLLAANGLLFRLVGNYPGRDVANLVLFGVLVVAVWWRVMLLLRVTRRDGKKSRLRRFSGRRH